MLTLLNANALSIPLADQSVQCVVTSPPYFSLRDYGVAGQLGLEKSPEEYVENMVRVFREVGRVLRDDGTLWLNLGDSYAGSGGAGGDYNEGGLRAGQPKYKSQFKIDRSKRNSSRWGGDRKVASLKPKDLIGIPWRVAFALQADGWYLRSDIIWHKPNPMPESVTDRPTKAHEYVFLLSKNSRYFYDMDAVREPHSREWWTETVGEKYMPEGVGRNDRGKREGNGTPAGRNRRTVWSIATAPTPYAHFATYPPALVEPCIKAGTSERGCCPVCGAPWERVTERVGQTEHGGPRKRADAPGAEVSPTSVFRTGVIPTKETVGWRPTCDHDADPRPCIVLDPFAGSGTTGMVARKIGRSFVGLDLSFTYLHDIARRRLELDALDAWTNGIQAGDDGYLDLPLFTEAQ